MKHFQFTAWPDHGVPEHPLHLLYFIRRVRASIAPQNNQLASGNSSPPGILTPPAEASGPLVVHCSAGVGRTGAYIAIDSQMERIRVEQTVDVFGHVLQMRQQRNSMVQTEEQYIFIYEALLEASQGGQTEVSCRNLLSHFNKLMQPVSLSDGTMTNLELEFKKLAQLSLTQRSVAALRFTAASQMVNKFKNRLANILPFDSTRVKLQPIRGVDGSDYINASFIDGYRFRNSYIASQAPLAETTDDFWRMLWEQNSTIVVMLTKLREMGHERCHLYWPTDRPTRFQYFAVEPLSEYNMTQYVLREFKITDARDGHSRTIRQFHFVDWPDQGVPRSGEAFIDFIGQVHKTKEQFGQDGPITVHCSSGVGRTGVFLALSLVLDQMRFDGVSDLFSIVRTLRTQRPMMVQTEEQYTFCYKAAIDYLSSFEQFPTA